MTTPRKRRATRQSFGRTRQERGGRWSAAYMNRGTLWRAPATFAAKMDAVAWLSAERRLIDLGTWTPPATRGAAAGQDSPTTVADYARAWLAHKQASRRTLDSYAYLLDTRLYGTALAAMPIASASARDVREWFAGLDASTPSAKARAYQAVSSMFTAAVEDELLAVSPARVRGAATVRRARAVTHIDGATVEALASKMPPHLGAAVLLAAWCGLRKGEVLGLDRGDLAENGATVSITKGLVRRNRVTTLSPPKSEAGTRSVAIPSHVDPQLVAHLTYHTGPGRHAPLFTDDATGQRISEGRFRSAWYRARAEVGCPTLWFHDLRHHAGVVAAQAGATLTESMARMGHSSPKMALHYAEVAAGRDQLLAERIAALANAAPPQPPTRLPLD